VFGSHVLWNDLLRAGLVDEIHLMVGPAVLGSGTSAFEGGLRVPLRLLDARTLDDSALVLLRYQVGER
jgi:dihydrofolate reductase